MESFRLKNIIILILALMNLFLLVSLYGRASARQESQDRTKQQLYSYLCWHRKHLR